MVINKFNLRRYQERAVENFIKWSNTDSKLATIILPTGTGKTRTASACIETVKSEKILWVAHREELIDQAYEALSSIIPEAHIEKEMAEHKADPSCDIVVGSVQTLARKRKHFNGFKPKYIVIDEYHHKSENNTTYQGLLDRWPDAKILGLTATPWRSGGEELPLGDILFQMDIGTAIKYNYLVKPVPDTIKTDVSLANVKTRLGDFAINDLSKAVNVDSRNIKIAKKIIELVRDGKRQGILFNVDVAHSKSMYELLKNEVRAAEVYGDTPKEKRRYLMEKMRNGEIDVLTNNLVTTEGFDVPHISYVCVARPTKLLGLYYQMIGRGLRTYPNKNDCIIVDVFDKIKMKQSRVTFVDMAQHGDIYGDRRRAANLLEAPLKKQLSETEAATIEHFPVFVRKPIEDRWTIDEDAFSISSWVIAPNQHIITWTEETTVAKTISKKTWKKLTPDIVNSIKEQYITVKHNSFGEGHITNIKENNVLVDFGWGNTKLLTTDSLEYYGEIKEFSADKEKIKQDKLFYLCFPDDVEKGRLIECIKNKQKLIVKNDLRLNKFEANEYVKKAAQLSGVYYLTRSDAKWKKGPISEKQKSFIESCIRQGKIGFDLDLDSVSKGDASAIIEQLKWQNLINNKFGGSTKEELLGYDSSVEDV